MEYPIIEEIKINSNFKYLWLKYVNGYDLDNHCARSLVGSYSKKINNKIANEKDILLNEHNSKTYYLCGVSLPFNYDNNFHLAFKYSKGNNIIINENGVDIKIIDAERIIIKKQDIYNHEKGYNRQFSSCRNWQFAYQQKLNL